MNCMIGCYSVMNGNVKNSVIAYGRESLVAASTQVIRYKPYIGNINKLHQSLPIEQKEPTKFFVNDVVQKTRETGTCHR